jgi:hypothetical protein
MSSTGVNFRAFVFFIIYVNDLPPTLIILSVLIIFADGTSVIIFIKNLEDFYILPNKILTQMSKWFFANKLFLNLAKTNVIKFKTKNLTRVSI